MSVTNWDVLSLLQHLRGLGDLGVIMEVMGGRIVTPLSVVRLCGREVLPRGPLTCVEVHT
jgi:hypothetical protein